MEHKEPRSIKFDLDKWAALSELAKEDGTTPAALVRKAVYDYIKKRKGAAK